MTHTQFPHSVVVVDDDPASRQLLATLLHYKDFHVFQAADGAEALELIERERPQLVISDLMMPRMDGFELAHRMRLDPELAQTPVIFYTASYRSDAARHLAAECGAHAMIYKPAEPDAVYAAVTAAMRETGAEAPSSDPARFGSLHQTVLLQKTAEQSAKLHAAEQRLVDLAACGHAMAAYTEPREIIRAFCRCAREILRAPQVGVALAGSGGTLADGVVCDEEGQLRAAGAERRIPSALARPSLIETGFLDESASGALAELMKFPADSLAVRALPVATGQVRHGWIIVGSTAETAKTTTDFTDGTLELLAAQLAASLDAAFRTTALAINYQILFDNVPDGLVQVTLAGRVRAANAAMAGMLGSRSGADLHGTFVQNWYANPADRDRLIEAIDAKGAVTNFETELKRDDGSGFAVLISAQMLRPADGAEPYLDGSVRDVSALREAQREIKRADQRMKLALATSRSGIGTVTAGGRSFAWGDTIPAVFGVPVEALPSTLPDMIALIHPDDRERGLADLAAFVDRRTHNTRFRVVGADRKVRWIEVVGGASGGDGDETELVGILTDVTEQHELAEHYRQVQRVEAVGQAVGGVAHDFNNMLTAILGFADLASDALPEDSPARHDLAEVQRAAERAAGLTRQLLAFSRRQVMNASVVDLDLLISDMMPMVERMLGERVRVGLHPGGVCSRVKVDAGQFEQVLMNLMLNARDAMPDGGVIDVTTSEVTLDSYDERRFPGARAGRHAVLEVRDSGTGMDEATIARIFEPFFTTKPPGKGTGLGLSTVFGIVKQCDGHVYVKSEPGAGTTFSVLLPAEDNVTNAATPSAAQPAPAARAAKTILLAEDEPAIRGFAKLVLERKGYRVLVADGVKAAAALAAAAGPIDLLVTDMLMPDGTGTELSALVQGDKPAIPVLYMSGYSDQTVGQDRGAGFLAKPFLPNALLLKVSELLHHAAIE